MSLTKLMKDDDGKYIAVSDFIELMVRHTNDSSDVVIEYLVKYSFAKGNDVKIYLKGCFNEYSDEWTLSELLANDTNRDLRPYTLSELKAEEDFARSYFLKKDIFNARYIKALKLDDDSLSLLNIGTEQQRLISNAPPPPNHIKVNSPFKQRTIGDLIETEKRNQAIFPNEFQRMTMLYDYFTPHQACCFIAGLPPNFDKRNYDLEMAEVIIEGGFKSGKLIADDDQQIKSDDLKLFLYSKNWLMKGFNDNLIDDTDKISQSSQQLLDVQEKAAPLATDYDDMQAPHIIYPAEHPKDNTPHTNLGKYQKELITYDVFTPIQIACLILNYPPESSSTDREFISCFLNIDAAINAGELTIFNEGNEENDVEARNIDAQQVKVWLARNNYIYKDFNDNIPTDPVAQVRQLTTQLADAQATIKQITNNYEKALARIEAKEQSADSFKMGSPTVEQGEPKTSEQIISEFREQITQLTAENKELNKQLDKANTVLIDAPADEVQLTGIAKYNADKAMVIITAKAIAKYIWSMDSTEAIRTGDMMQQVRHVMHNIHPELLPDDKAIREWLSGIAPDYAKKAGKPSKNAPDEITLTMKK